MDYDVLIIGAGMSGLAAGIRLAHFGKKVCILERHYRVGGLNSYYSFEGRKFDVGLHAMTNYVPAGTRGTPMTKLLRQLRFKAEDLALCEQTMSAVRFGDAELRFTNDFAFFREEVYRNFPGQADSFEKLTKVVLEYDELALDARPVSARSVVSGILTDPLLTDMLFCPLMYYGNAQQHDMEFGQFVIMFKSIFLEGFARPRDGVRHIIDLLVRKYKESGGDLRVRAGVRSARVSGSKVTSVELDSGEVLTADKVMSCAGYVETMDLLSGNGRRPATADQVGQMSFVESIFVLDRQPMDLGLDKTIVFFNRSDRFRYRRPDEMVDYGSGVICCPNNFRYSEPLQEGIVRITNMANFDLWNRLGAEDYLAQKELCRHTALEEAVKVVPDFRSRIVCSDTFTPRTIHRFTGHLNGAVYGSPVKLKNGATHLENLFICGTDQGFLGIVGAMLSGISMANLHILKAS